MLTARQIEAARRAINRYIKRGGKVWIRIFPDKAPTLQSAGRRRAGRGSGRTGGVEVEPAAAATPYLSVEGRILERRAKCC